jgi:hypothetical protein
VHHRVAVHPAIVLDVVFVVVVFVVVIVFVCVVTSDKFGSIFLSVVSIVREYVRIPISILNFTPHIIVIIFIILLVNRGPPRPS